MTDIVVTGASRGIGRALALALAERGDLRLVLVARDAARLEQVRATTEARGARAVVVPGDLASIRGARALGARLRDVVAPHATLVHNAGIWPSTLRLGPEGLEESFVANHLGPLAMQQALLDAGLVERILVVSAGLLVKGRFDAERTPRGADFSAFRTYCTTKLCFALAMRDVAAEHPELDVVVLHPGVVRTDLGAREGLLGRVLDLVKRRWEDPVACAERLARILARERWGAPGDARWLVEEAELPWPEVANDEEARRALRETSAALLAAHP